MRKSGKNFLIGLTVFLVMTAAILVTLNVLFTVVPVKGESMYPTVSDGDRVVVWKPAELKRGDVAVFMNPDKASEHKKLIKRVLALPGDTVETRISEGKLRFFVNGAAVDDSYANGDNLYEQPLITVRDGAFYYLGDNRTVSLDSRTGYFGELKDVVGVVLLRMSEQGISEICV